MKGDLLGYRFGGTEEAYVVPVIENADPVHARLQKEWVEQHQGVTEFALCAGVCVWCDQPDGGEILAEVRHHR